MPVEVAIAVHVVAGAVSVANATGQPTGVRKQPAIFQSPRVCRCIM